MAQRPTIPATGLVLRPFEPGDAPEVTRLCAERDIASGTMFIPHPYALGDAQGWLATHQELFDSGKAVQCAITLASTGGLIGAVGLLITAAHDRAELGYWIGKPYWGRGHATNAGRAIVRYGFEHLPLNRIDAYHYARNPASGRVLQKIGMKQEGVARQLYKKWGSYEDCPLYAILRSDYESADRHANNHP